MSEEHSKKARVMVIGARGFLGTFFTNQAAHTHEVSHANRTRATDRTDVIVNITDRTSVVRAFADVKPDTVVLLAAMSDIDRCERDPEEARAVNLDGAMNVAQACADSGARLLFTSTGAVFDGLKQGYTEDDAVTPISVYGETKARAEAALLKLLPKVIIARVSLVLGRTDKAGTNSLLDTMIRRWKAGEAVSASTSETRNPIDARTLSTWFLELLSRDENAGIFHTGSTDSMSRYQLAQRVAERLHIDLSLIRQESSPAPGRAPRGRDHLLLTNKIRNVCPTPPPSCEEVIIRSLNEVA